MCGKLVIAFLSIALANPATGRTWRIQPDGSGDAPTIQAGIDSSAATGDSVVVAAGLYDETLVIPRGKSIVLRGASAELTVVDGGRRDAVLGLLGSGVVEGFTFRRGQAPVGGGVLAVYSPGAFVRNNIIEENIAEWPGFGSGGGVYLDYDTNGVVLEGNIIRNNHSGEEGGGVAVHGGLVQLHELRNNMIIGNSSYLGGGGVSFYRARLLGNVIANNSSMTFGGGIFVGLDGGGEIRGNTIVGNVIGYPNEGAGIKIAGSPLISHNIIAHNVSVMGVGAGVDCQGALAHPTLECNDVWGNGDDSIAGCGTTGPGNFSLDPVFCDAEKGEYHLADFSPCLPANNSCARR